MSAELSPQIQAKQADNNFSQAPSMIQHLSHRQITPINSPHLPSFINHILHPQSIFSSCASQPSLEDYLKIKSYDKPKDTLRGIQHKKQAFVNYVKTPQLQCDPLKTSIKIQNDQNTFSRIKQQFSEFTFYKNCKSHMLLFIRITPSRTSKCNISVCNILGEIFKYYPNVFLSKKEGKIIKFITENKESFIIVYDYTKVEATLKTFPSLLNQAHLLYYVIFDLEPHRQIFNPIIEKIKQNATGVLKNANNNVVLISNGVCELNVKTYLEEISLKLKYLQKQQQQFLDEFRGYKSNHQRNLTFDMMVINLWRQFKWTGVDLVNKIIQLFIKKERQMDQMIVKDPQVHHTPKRLSTCQNCTLCLTKALDIKRPRRTYWICTSCSAEKQKPIYLCKGCFKSYHTRDDVYLYKKNQKKTKKYQANIRKRKIQIRKDRLEVKQEDIKRQQKTITENDKRLMDLDHKCEEFFTKLDQLIEEKCFSSAEFYLQMLMNMSILKTQQYLNKVSKQDEGFIKIQENK